MEIKFTDGFLEDCERLGLSKVRGRSLRHLYWKLIPYDWRPGQLWYRFKCFVWHRYTTVHPRTLPWHTWCDRDKLMLHCCFEILCQFLEKECSPGTADWDHDDEHRKVMAEMRELYRWWKDDYQRLEGDMQFDEEFRKEVNDRLTRLIGIRDWMWT